jgi:hypothetical protein
MANQIAHLAVSEEYRKLGLKKKVIQQFEDGIRTTGKKGEFEWWYYDAKMNDGSTLVLTFFLNNATDTSGGFHPSVKIELTRADGTEVSDRVFVDENDCEFSKTRCNVKIGENVFEGDLKTYHILVKTDKIEADISLEGNVAAWRSATGHIYFGDDKYFAWFPSVPEGITRASIKVDGKVEKYEGTGYHDHNWGNAPMMDVLHHWYWGRAKIGPYTVISCYITSTKKYGYTHLPIFMLANGEKLICDNPNNINFHQLEPAYSENTRKHYHKTLVYDYKGKEGHYKITYKFKNIISSFSLLADGGKEPSKIQTTLLRVVGLDPTYDRFNGEATIEKIENGKVTETYTNPATWEMMYFKRDKDV